MTDQKEKVISNYLASFEKMRDRIHFPTKTPKDDLVCPICGGHFKRRDKSKHSKGKKHKQMLPLILSGRVMPYVEWAEYSIEENDESGSDEESLSEQTKSNTKKNSISRVHKTDGSSDSESYSDSGSESDYDN